MLIALPENDPRWTTLIGGKGRPFDSRKSLKDLRRNPLKSEAWRDLWENLHHQGDVGEASYLALVELICYADEGVDFNWNFYALIAAIEARRHKDQNPALPAWLVTQYNEAWEKVLPICLKAVSQKNFSEPYELRAVLSVIALAKSFVTLGEFLVTIDESEIDIYFEGQWPE